MYIKGYSLNILQLKLYTHRHIHTPIPLFSPPFKPVFPLPLSSSHIPISLEPCTLKASLFWHQSPLTWPSILEYKSWRWLTCHPGLDKELSTSFQLGIMCSPLVLSYCFSFVINTTRSWCFLCSPTLDSISLCITGPRKFHLLSWHQLQSRPNETLYLFSEFQNYF